MARIETPDLILASLVDEGFAKFEIIDNDFIDTCLVCGKIKNVHFITPEKEWVSNEWSYKDTFASKALMKHMTEFHPEVLTLVSMKTYATKN